MTKLTPKNSPQYLTVQECQEICRFRGPEGIRRAVNRGDLTAIKLRANRTLILATSFWAWFHQHDVKVAKPNSVQMPTGPIKKPKEVEVEA